MKNVLIVTPRFPPVNAADHQRIRMALPYFRQYGWQPTVLCVDPEFVESGQDIHLLKSVPTDISVESVAAIPQSITRKFGFGGLSWRAKRSLNRRGKQLLSSRAFDLVYFSTTEFGVLPLAREWKNKFNIPYVLDIQDPWVNDYYQRNGMQPPGGQWKHRLTQKIAQWQEPETLRGATAITVVSKQYQEDLIDRYSFLSKSQFHVLPFGGPVHDFEILDRLGIDLPTKSSNSPQQWVYAGRGGCDMQFSLRAFFCSIRKAIDRAMIDPKSFELRLYGTDYSLAGKGQRWADSAAREFGITELVKETPDRIPYFETLQRLRHADALFVPGSDDPGYTASKIYPYILARRPLLTLFHENSSVNTVIEQTQSATSVSFHSQSTVEAVAEQIVEQWFLSKTFMKMPQTNWSAFDAYSAQTMTKKLSDIFSQSLTPTHFRLAS